MTVGEHLRSWLTSAAAHRQTKHRSLAMRSACRLHLTPVIGRVQLGELAPAHIEKLIQKLTSRGCQPKSVRNTLAVLNRALTVAERQGLVTGTWCGWWIHHA